MIVVIDDLDNIQIVSPNDFEKFHIQCSQKKSASEICELLGGGSKVIDDEHIWLSAETVRDVVPEKIDSWERGFSQMIDYAASKGWTENNGALIRSHIEWAKVKK